ncbi:MAG: hypothetical protein C5B47_00210 [Verrucomicrobia bacterium]|nr:MAG: hypothetical protein C5B47_00210 [Verrucomicrobiota bacterium]
MDVKEFVLPQKIFLVALIIICLKSIAFGQPQALPAYERQLMDLAKVRFRADDYANELATGRLFQIYAQLQEQLAWAKSLQGLLDKPDLSTAAIDHLQDLSQQIRAFYKSYISTEILGDKEAYEKPDLIIILGAGGAQTLEERTQSALPLIKRFPEAKVLVSGGGRGIRLESEEMRRMLVEKGVDGARVIEESDSLDTLGNAVFSKLVMSQQKIAARTILLVTSDFHAPRALLIFKSILGGNARIAAVLAPHPASDSEQRIDKELKNGAESLREMLSYQKIPGAITARRIEDPSSALYQMVIHHDLYKNRWDLIRKYETGAESQTEQ